MLYAAGLVAARVALGYMESGLLPAGSSILWGLLATFVCSTAILAPLGAGNSPRPYADATAVLAITCLADVLIHLAMAPDVALPWAFLALSWTVVAIGVYLGTSLGVAARQRRRPLTRAD
jgi:hypothetical protein